MSATGPVDEMTMRVLDEHLITGPRPGQCRCGYGDATLPAERLGKPHSLHLVEKLREAGVLKEST